MMILMGMERWVSFYFDDILVYGEWVRVCIRLLDEVLIYFSRAGMVVKGTKCRLMVSR